MMPLSTNHQRCPVLCIHLHIKLLRTSYLFVANYMGGNAAAIPVEADGKLGKATDSVDLTQFFKPQPHGRQEKSHPHGVSFSTKHSSLYVCDLGCTKNYPTGIFKVGTLMWGATALPLSVPLGSVASYLIDMLTTVHNS